MNKTITLQSERGTERPRRGFLTIAFCASRPEQHPLRFDLGEACRVRLGRGSVRRHELGHDGILCVELDDPTMSQPHAMLELDGDGWTVVDQGSKNGTTVNGERVECRALEDGAVIAMGETFAVYRTASVDARPLVLDGARLASDPRSLRTMHPSFEDELRRVRRAAGADIPLLVLGETGTGKELIARAVHDLSRRSGKFVAINCGAIPESILASELFGVRRGAFSGANADRLGLIRAADGGTLLLDEIGEMGASSQVALLRVLQERQVTPVGDTTPVPVDVRVIAATHRDLPKMAAAGRFRDDLLARLAGLVITLPPLRERREDLGSIVAGVLADSQAPAGTSFTPDAAQLLFGRQWRHNIRELRQSIAAAIATGVARIERADLEGLGEQATVDPPPEHPPSAPGTGRGTADAKRLAALIEAHGGNVSAIARELSTSRTQVTRLMERYGLSRNRE